MPTISDSLRRYLFEYPARHLRDAEHRAALAAVGVFLIAALAARYSGLVSPFLDNRRPVTPGEVWLLMGEFAVLPYAVSVALSAACGGWRRPVDWQFWWLGLVGIACLAWVGYGDQWLDWGFLGRFLGQLSLRDTATCAPCKVWNGALDGLVHAEYCVRAIAGYVAGPLLVAAASWRRRQLRLGLTLRGVDLRAYAVLLVVCTPLLVAASQQADFLRAYPRYEPGATVSLHGLGAITSLLVFELLYALQFVALEYFFRGFLVYSLEPYLGGRAVVPMVCVYCFIHFVKPLPEACGAIAGGYLLGVIALYSRSIVGGMPVHIGIALILEALSIFQHLAPVHAKFWSH